MTNDKIKAGVSGGVSAVMPYVAIGVLGYLGLRELKKVDVGGAAGQIVDSVGDAAEGAVSYVTKTVGDTVTNITNVLDVASSETEKYGGEIANQKQLADAIKNKSNVIFVKGKGKLAPNLPVSNVIMKSEEVKGLGGDVTRFIAPDLSGIVINEGEAARVQEQYGTVDQPIYTSSKEQGISKRIAAPRHTRLIKKSSKTTKTPTAVPHARHTDAYGQTVDNATGNILSSSALKHPSAYQKRKYGIK